MARRRAATRIGIAGYPMKVSSWSSIVLSTVLEMAVPFNAYPQVEIGGGAQASAPPTALAPLAQKMPDERVQQIRLQLSQTSDGDQHYRLLTELAQGYWTDERVSDYLRVRTEIVDDSVIPAGRRSIAASELALSLALSNNSAASDRMIARAKSLAHDTDPTELETLRREPDYAYLVAEAEIARRFQNQHDVALLKYREHAELSWKHFTDPSLSERRHRAAANEMLNSVAELTRIMVQNNRRGEALSYTDEIAWYVDHRPELQPTLRQRAIAGMARAIALCSFDAYDAALEAINGSISMFKRAGSPEHDGDYAQALRMRLMIALAMGKIEAYRADAEALDRARAINPIVNASVSAEELDSLSMAARGEWANAAARIGEVIRKTLRAQGCRARSTNIDLRYRCFIGSTTPRAT